MQMISQMKRIVSGSFASLCLLLVCASVSPAQGPPCGGKCSFYGTGLNNGQTQALGSIYCSNGPGAGCLNVSCGSVEFWSGKNTGSVQLVNVNQMEDVSTWDSITSITATAGSVYTFWCNGLPAPPGDMEGAITINESYPIINQGGVVNDATNGNSVTVPSSGNFSVYGVALTGGTGTKPTVSVDDSTIVLAVTYPSDTQVNLSFTIGSGTTLGTHSLYLTTAEGKSNAGTFVVN
jgi:hypothetical protein